jgi:hypothetical protein
MPEVEAYDVTAVTQGDLETVVPIVTVMAKAYTRGRGFDDTTGQPNDEIAAVITTAAARLAANGAQLAADNTAGPFAQSIRGGFTGWSLAEQFVLNRYRVRAQ